MTESTKLRCPVCSYDVSFPVRTITGAIHRRCWRCETVYDLEGHVIKISPKWAARKPPAATPSKKAPSR